MTTGPTMPANIVSAFLSLCELFSDVDPAILNGLTSEVRLVTVERGETLMRQGDPADCMYAIVSGRLQLFSESDDGTQRFLAELRSGETVGEVDVMDGRPRMTTARAVRDTELVKVSRLGFERLVGGSADTLNKVANILAGRMRGLAHREHPVPPIRTIAVLSAGGSSSPSFAFSTKLCEALGAFGTVLHLSEERFRRIYGRTFDSSSGIAARLGELEGAHRFIVLEADVEGSEFARHCVRQADRVLVAGRAWSSPDLSPAEKMLFDKSGRQECTRGIGAAARGVRPHLLGHSEVAGEPGGSPASPRPNPSERRHEQAGASSGRGRDRFGPGRRRSAGIRAYWSDSRDRRGWDPDRYDLRRQHGVDHCRPVRYGMRVAEDDRHESAHDGGVRSPLGLHPADHIAKQRPQVPSGTEDILRGYGNRGSVAELLLHLVRPVHQ